MPEDLEREPRLLMVGKKRGRPRVGEPLKITLPSDDLDKLFALAHDHGLSVSGIVRQIVTRRLKAL